MLQFRSIYLDTPVQTGRIFDLFSPEEEAKHDTALFFIHGGGWHGGSRTGFHSIIEACIARGYEAATTDYRLTVSLFDQVADIREALSRYADDLEQRGRPRRVALIGSSAGAHLALMTALSPWTTPSPATIAGIAVQAAPFTFEPWADIFPAIWREMQKAVRASYADAPERFRAASPIHLLSPESPPVFAQHAENEHMFPLSLAEDFAVKAALLGVPVTIKTYPRTEHGFFYNLDRWQQREALEDTLAFIESLPR